ncbi:MAG: pimeloyl-ACP methyl ester carboxylesterase [Gammaproteobacteria bacterium]|jgi:pimeloyl-ACP methyl ester carboxylesterase
MSRSRWQSVGTGHPLIRPPTWFNHLGFDWQVQFRSALYSALASQCQLIRYDGRGSGMSQRHVPEIALETSRLDLDAVVKASNLQNFALLGISLGGPVAIAYPAHNPNRISKLILNGAYALGRTKRGSTRDRETGEAYLTLMRHGWGDENSAFLRSYGSLYFPSASAEALRASAEVQRMAMTGEVAVRTRVAFQRHRCHTVVVENNSANVGSTQSG